MCWPSWHGWVSSRGARRTPTSGAWQQRVSLITLGVADVRAARDFYERLGWTCANDSDAQGVAFFQAGGMASRSGAAKSLRRTAPSSDGGGWGGVTLAYNVGSPAEVDAVIDEAEAAGASIGRPGAETFWGGYSGVFIDPDGHPWEVGHNPHWTIAEDGSIDIG